MDILSLLLIIGFVLLVGWAAYWLINRFIPGGMPRTVALVVVGILLLLFLLTQVGLIGGAEQVLTTPVET